MIGPAVDRTGQRFGPYEITQFLGRGGFADVFLGRNVHLPEQVVAIKVLDKIMIRSDKVRQFKNEAAIILALQHPSIIRFYSYDIFYNPQHSDTAYPYIVMEYAAKGNLRRTHPRGTKLPLETIVSYVQQIASALQYAHGNQVMHLDVKPENILLNNQGKLLLSDFGLATLMSGQEPEEIQGTPSYMAPEQVQGHPDKASDQYSLAVMVYEWICGSVPFSAPTIQDYIQKLVNNPPAPLIARIPTLSPAVEAVVMKALSKNVGERYASVLQFADHLEKAITQPNQVVISATNPPAIVNTPPAPAPQKKASGVTALPTQQPQPPQAINAGAAKQGTEANQPQVPPPTPVPEPPSASMPAAQQAANQSAAVPDPQVANKEEVSNPVEATPDADEQSPFLDGWPPGSRAAGGLGIPSSPQIVEPAAIGSQGRAPSGFSQSPFLDGKPPNHQAGATPNQQAHSGRSASMRTKSPFLGASSPADQRNLAGKIYIGPQSGFADTETVANVNYMDHPGPPSLPPYLGRPGNGTVPPEEHSLQDFFSQTMHDIFQPRGRRRRSPLYAVGIAANFIGSIFIGVWLGHTFPTYGNESAWLVGIFSLLGSFAAFWLFDYSGSKLIKVAASLILTVFWTIVGYSFGTLIGAGTKIGFLPDANIMAVLFFIGTLTLCISKTFRSA